MKNKNILYLVYPLLITAMIFWAYSFIWGKQALLTYNPITITYFRTLVSTIVLGLVLLILRKNFSIDKKDIPTFILLAFFEPFLYFLGETNGLTKIDASSAGIIIGTIPLITPFAAYFFLNEKITILNIVGIILSIIGIAIMAFDQNMHLTIPLDGLLLLGLAICATIGFTITVKKIPQKYSVFSIVFYQNLIGSLLFLPLMIIFEREAIMEVGFVADSAWPILKLGIFASSMAFLFYTFALRYIPVARANIFTNIIPVFTLIFSVIILGDIINSQKITGIIIVLLGVFVSQMNFKRRP